MYTYLRDCMKYYEHPTHWRLTRNAVFSCQLNSIEFINLSAFGPFPNQNTVLSTRVKLEEELERLLQLNQKWMTVPALLHWHLSASCCIRSRKSYHLNNTFKKIFIRSNYCMLLVILSLFYILAYLSQSQYVNFLFQNNKAID